MKKLIRKLSKRNKAILISFLILLVGYLVTFILFTNSLLDLKGVESLVRYIIIGFFFLYFLVYFMHSLVKIIERKYKSYIGLSVLTLLFIIIFTFSTYFVGMFSNVISGLGASDTINYTSYLVTLNENNIDSDSELGIISVSEDSVGNELSNKLLEAENLSNKTILYDDYFLMLKDLYDDKIDGILVQGNYATLYTSEEEFDTLLDETKEVYSYEEERENEDIRVGTDKSFDEPLTFLIIGVDSEFDGLDSNAAFNGDTLMMITFNPSTLNTTIFSLPRDIMVPIACRSGDYAKINSSAASGTNCVLDTVEDLTGISIDYYVKINFNGVVDLVDAIGGIEVYVEEPDYDYYGNNLVCEQNSNRQEDENKICIESGLQHLDGEEALAYSRNRKQYLQSDISRNAHQQAVVEAVINKATSINSLDEVSSILSAIQSNINTNMEDEQILSSYEVLKEILLTSLSGNQVFNIEKSYLEYYDLRVWLPSSQIESSSLGYYEDSLEDIINSMEVNLEIEEPTSIKTFNYSVNEPYESVVAGKGHTSNRVLEVLKNFVGLSKDTAEDYCDSNNISCDFIIVDSNSDYYNENIDSDMISHQDIRHNTLLKDVNEVTFYINGEKIEKENDSDGVDTDDNDQVDQYIQDMIE